MRRIFETITAAFAMFSAFPTPKVEWNQENLRWMLCAFPMVGAAIGLLCWGWAALAEYLSFPALLRGAGLTLIPVLTTGGIHLDGYADTWDALSSHAPPGKKQEILKDPRLGAFAAIHLCAYFVAEVALWTALPRYDGLMFLWVFCLSRTLSGLSVVRFPLAKSTGLAHALASAAEGRRLRALLSGLAALLGAGLCLRGPAGVGALLAALGVLCRYRRVAVKEFGGLSGDLAGWFLQTAELWMLGAACAVQYGEGLL